MPTTRQQMPAASQVAANQQQAMIASNHAFMRGSLEKTAYCPVTGGSGTSAAYSPGVTLYFDLPVIGGGYVKDLLITYNLTVTPATAGGAAYAVNAAAPWNIFSELKLDYGPTQVRTHPYFLKVLDALRGFSTGVQNKVVAGNNDATIAAQIASTTPVVVNTGNTWQGKMLLRLNALGSDSVPGILPIMGVGNKPQLKLTCTSAFMGSDPLLNCVNGTGGASPSVAVTGTINVDAIFLDGINMANPQPLQLNLSTEPTLQYYWDSALTPFSASSVQWKNISVLLEHWYMASIIIDGLQSSQFSTLSNITSFALSPDTSGQNTFKSWNYNNNVSIYDYFDREVRRIHGQDLDPGVILWVDAPARGITDADNKNGHQILNMEPNGGYTATTHRYQMGSVGSGSITPRVETFLISMNKDGLRIA